MKKGPWRGLLFAWRTKMGNLPKLMCAVSIILTKDTTELHMKPGHLKVIIVIGADLDVEEEADRIIAALDPFLGAPVSWDVVDPKTTLLIA